MPRQTKRRPSSSRDDEKNQLTTNTKTHMNKGPMKLIISGIVLLVAIVIFFTTIKIETIQGNQLGIMETWAEGVRNEIMQPKTYFLVPGFNKHVYKYDASSQVFVMNDKSITVEKGAAGRDKDSYLVQSQEGQDMKISLNLRWRINPAKLVYIHKTVRLDIEEKIIRPVVMRVVKDKATKMKAIDAYSGEGLVKLQAEIQDALSGKDKNETDELAERGVQVENFVIEHIELDPKYIEEIKGKQIATQKTLRAGEEQRAATAEAEVAKQKAMSEYNTKLIAQMLMATNMVIQAQADNERVIIAAKAAAQQVIVAAEAQKKQLELEGEGKKLGMTAMADGTLAQGKAEAAARELMLKAYAVPGSDNWVKVEVSKNLGAAFAGIKGYLPEKMTINTFTDNFLKGLDVSTGNAIVTPPTK